MRSIDLIYRVLRKILRKLMFFDYKKVKSILVYPKFNTYEGLIETLNKLAWYLPDNNQLIINILISDKLKESEILKISNIPYQRNYLKNNLCHFKFVRKAVKSDLVLFTQAKSLLIKPHYLYKSEIVDKNYFSLAESTCLNQLFSKLLSNDESKGLENLSRKNYRSMLDENKKKTSSFCFVTGPSFDNYKEFKYPKDAFKVICNSIVKNKDFLDYIKGPDLLVFADPVFHFSSNEYSALFRDKVLEVFLEYKPYIVVPFNSLGLLLSHYPELKDKIIGMKSDSKGINFPTEEKLQVKESSNILTFYMLPIASALTEKINIIGADGRQKNETYFWKHSENVQFSGLMDTVFKTHPSFFKDRNYNDYYEQHCQFLDNFIEYGENKGKRYFSLTNSYIPALSKRKKN